MPPARRRSPTELSRHRPRGRRVPAWGRDQSSSAKLATLRYWIDPCPRPEHVCRAGDVDLAQWAIDAWQAASGGKLKLEKAPSREKAHIRLYWSGGRDGLYG